MRRVFLALSAIALALLLASAAEATPGALDRFGCHGHGRKHHCHGGMAGRHFVGYGGGGYRFAHRHGRHWGRHGRHRRY